MLIAVAYIVDQRRRRSADRAARPPAEDGAVASAAVTGRRRAARCAGSRARGRAASGSRCSCSSPSSSSSGRSSRPTARTQIIGPPVQGPSARCAARHRPPRARRAQPGPLGRPRTCSLSPWPRRSPATSIGGRSGSSPGYTRSTARRGADARARRLAGLPADPVPAPARDRRRLEPGRRAVGIAAAARAERSPASSAPPTLEVSVRGYVEAAVARGESTARGPAPRDPAEHRRARSRPTPGRA